MAAHPDFPWLAAGDVETLGSVLRELGWLAAGEAVKRCEPAGAGNMNLTLRVETAARSLVVKQARPWVERYPEIPAPWDRARAEQAFYQEVAGIAGVADRMPRILGCSPAARLLAMEDLPGARDLSFLYSRTHSRMSRSSRAPGTPCDAVDTLQAGEIGVLADYLARLHGASERAPSERRANRAMRALNHEHIFVIPLSPDADLALDEHEPGLAEAARALRADDDFRRAARATGERYLADGRHLVHGDYFPGSWLRTDDGLRFIDPEFSFGGDPEVDLGCAIAHLALADCPRAHADAMLDAYRATAGAPSVDAARLARYAAMEVVRRLVGVAQLPIPPSDGARAALLARARIAMLEAHDEALWS